MANRTLRQIGVTDEPVSITAVYVTNLGTETMKALYLRIGDQVIFSDSRDEPMVVRPGRRVRQGIPRAMYIPTGSVVHLVTEPPTIGVAVDLERPLPQAQSRAEFQRWLSRRCGELCDRWDRSPRLRVLCMIAWAGLMLRLALGY